MSKQPAARVVLLIALCVFVPALSAAAGVTLQFNYALDSGFFASGSDARATLEAAGDFFEGILDDDLSAIVPGGVNHWDARFTHPSTGASGYQIHDLIVPADTLIVYVGARDLGGTTLGQGGPGGYSVSGYQEFLDTVTTRGEGTTSGAFADDFGPWGGVLSMDIDTNWNRDYQVNPTSSQSDLYSTIFHELGHLLGVGTSASWTNQVSGSQFVGTAAKAEYGGPVPLSGSAHWASSVMSTVFPAGAAQEAAMDPTLTQGTRKLFTRLDTAALEDIGWEVDYSTVLLGDLDGDGFVGGADLDIVRSYWGQGVTAGNLLHGDPSGDGFVGGADLDEVRAHWGEGTPPAAPIPEPSALASLLVAALVFGALPARRRRSR